MRGLYCSKLRYIFFMTIAVEKKDSRDLAIFLMLDGSTIYTKGPDINPVEYIYTESNDERKKASKGSVESNKKSGDRKPIPIFYMCKDLRSG